MDTKNFNDYSAEVYKKNTQTKWDSNPCGVNASSKELMSKEFFEEVELYRYKTHPWLISDINKFDIKNKKVLEIGFGMGTDHLALFGSGGIMHGIDLTPKHLEITRKRFELYGFNSRLILGDAESLPYPNDHFDFIYSFGVAHHTPNTERIVSEIYRVLKPKGCCYVSVYHKNSIFFWWTTYLYTHLIKRGYKKYTLKQQLSLIEHPGDNPNLVIRLYTKKEFAKLFSKFSSIKLNVKHLIAGDIALLRRFIPDPERPRVFFNWLGKQFGWYVIVTARK